ncbi:MAG: carboxymuconolactone decarboxylase family protein [Myxococcota bacterium]|nr:carboxymuconolactone decarboxylase family protein [Myxococcota bacterium]
MADDTPDGSEIVERFKAPATIRKDFTQLILQTGGAIWTRPGLASAQRSIATIAVLVALCRPDELREHIEIGLTNGLTQQEICELILHCAMYAGFPAAVRAMEVAHDVFGE